MLWSNQSPSVVQAENREMTYRREISPGVTSPTEIPAEADGPYLLEVLRNPRKKTLIQTPTYKRYVVMKVQNLTLLGTRHRQNAKIFFQKCPLSCAKRLSNFIVQIYDAFVSTSVIRWRLFVEDVRLLISTLNILQLALWSKKLRTKRLRFGNKLHRTLISTFIMAKLG